MWCRTHIERNHFVLLGGTINGREYILLSETVLKLAQVDHLRESISC